VLTFFHNLPTSQPATNCMIEDFWVDFRIRMHFQTHPISHKASEGSHTRTHIDTQKHTYTHKNTHTQKNKHTHTKTHIDTQKHTHVFREVREGEKKNVLDWRAEFHHSRRCQNKCLFWTDFFPLWLKKDKLCLFTEIFLQAISVDIKHKADFDNSNMEKFLNDVHCNTKKLFVN